MGNSWYQERNSIQPEFLPGLSSFHTSSKHPLQGENTGDKLLTDEHWNIYFKANGMFCRFDEHWMPMSRLCSPCATNYDYVIKLEHFQHQIQRPLKMVGVNTPNIGWSHRTGSGNRWIINKYFNNLTLMDIKKLYVKYKRDFQLFGYTPYKYFKLGNK